MSNLQFSESDFLKAAAKEEDFTNTPTRAFEEGAEHYLKSFYSDAQENDFLDYDLASLIELAKNFWMFGNRRKIGETLLEVTPYQQKKEGRKDTAIKIVTDDMAFLVDSVVSAISSFGVNVSGLFHPIVAGKRNSKGKWAEDGTPVKESMILIITSELGKKTRNALSDELGLTLKDVHTINHDFKPLVETVEKLAKELKSVSGKDEMGDFSEGVDFLDWIAAGNFVLLGSRRYDFIDSRLKDKPAPDFASPKIEQDQQLGVLSDASVVVLRQSSEPAQIASNVKSYMNSTPPVTVDKSNLFSRVHRRVRMDFISVKHYDSDGTITGETRIVGLFTSDAYSRSPMFVPLIRQKVERVLKRAGHLEGSHNKKRLEYVLSSYPRDELFQISENDLLRISTGVAQAFDRPRTRIFARRDPFDRFVSVLVYVPQDQYSTRVREKTGERLAKAFNGRVSAFYPQYSDAPMARVHFIIGMDPDKGLNPDIYDLEAEISAIAQPWFDSIVLAAENQEEDRLSNEILSYSTAFSIAYQNAFTTDQALADISHAEKLSDNAPIGVLVYDMSALKEKVFRTKIYSLGARIEPSAVVPVIENFAAHVVQETGYELKRQGRKDVWVHDFEVRLDFVPGDFHSFAQVFESAFIATWNGQNEDDGFNRLVLPLLAKWRDIAFLRLIARYRRQSGLDPSEATQIEALEHYPQLAGLMLKLMDTKFNPSLGLDKKAREVGVEEIERAIGEALNDVRSLEHDRVLRRLASAIKAALRTNFFQTDENGQVKPYISVKLASREIDDLPAPKPYREIYISAPQVEGVHLRFGPVARGGLRWSDRRDDFRTEVLGLVKAQQVKNAVIVPVGSKGGFFPKQLPKNGTRDEWLAEGVSAYKTFISGILDLTDNYKGQDVVSPPDVICWDDDDPYLVVAADKGTATFSDIANGISQDYGFWLDDAFASGGSAGYDHKVMGITARGGWEAVKRHFREMGKDIQSEDFSVIGVGDMSGDVFGNGMLLSKHIRLIAAFNHLDIFIDPDPDPAKSFKERARMFALPRSTWQDYNKKLISSGGGVFSRSEKSLTLTDEIKAITGLSADEVTPNQLINALLKSEVELLWFGGIGTYIKASQQNHSDVGDKANDNLRIDGNQVKAAVIGEGANLGITQAGRIEIAQRGGRLNTDAIDNSAGVDSSDNEVNIKILLSGAIRARALKKKDRNPLLASMTDNVAHLVLQHNYDQTGALSLSEMLALNDHNAYERFMSGLERRGLLDRAVEGLPSSEAMQSLKAEKKGLTRPEIAVIMAYAKNVLFDDIIKTDVADDPFMDTLLSAYFPDALHKYKKAMAGHKLRREIITSRLVNLIVDVAGPLFTMRLQEQTQGTLGEITKSFMVAYQTLEIASLRTQIAMLDNKVDALSQTQLNAEIARVLQRVIAWMVRRGEKGQISNRIAQRDVMISVVDKKWLNLLSHYDKRRAEARVKSYVRSGIPKDLALDVALLRSRASGFDVAVMTEHTGWSITQAAKLFYEIGGRLKIDRIRASLLTTSSADHWERLAIRHLQENFYKMQARFAQDVARYHIAQGGKQGDDTGSVVQDWVKNRLPNIRAYEETVRDMTRTGQWTVSKFSIVNAQLSDLLEGL